MKIAKLVIHVIILMILTLSFYLGTKGVYAEEIELWDATSTDIFGNNALISYAETDQSSNLEYIIEESVKNNKGVFIPNGVYILNSDVRLRSGIRLIGDANAPTILKNTTGTEVSLKDENYSDSYNMVIEHLFFDSVSIFTRLSHAISINHNIFYHPISLFPVNLHTSKGAVMENNIFMRDKHHATPDTENRAIFVGGFATVGRYEYMEDVSIKNNLFGVKLNELDAIKSFSADSINNTINKLQEALESDQLTLKENEQNYFSTGINSYNNTKNILIKDNFFYQMYENDDRYGVIGDHAIYLRGSQDVQVIGNHVRGLHNGPYGGFKFKSGRNITIMNNYLRNTGIIMYETPEFGLGDDFASGTVAELSGWLVANNIFDFKEWQERYAIGIEYNRHTGIDNVYNGVFLDNHFVNYHNIPQNRRRDLLIQNSQGEGFKGKSTVVSGNTRDDRDNNQLDVEFWDEKEYQAMPSDWRSLVDSNLYEQFKDSYIPVRNTLPIGKSVSITLGEAINPYKLVDQINDQDEAKPEIMILNPDVFEQVGEHKVFLKLIYEDAAEVTITAVVKINAPETIVLDKTALDTTGQITFVSSEENETIVIPPETTPDVEIEAEVPGITGSLAIVKAATMDFGSQAISTQDQVYAMVSEMQKVANPLENGPTEVPYVSFAQVHDTRGTNAGWDLKVSLTDFISNSQNKILAGAQIGLIEPRIQYEGNNPLNSPEAHTSGLQLVPGRGSVSVMTAAKQTGAGISSVVWGNQEELTKQFEDEKIKTVKNNAIQLSIPGSTVIDAATYSAILKWELATAP